MIRSFQVLLFFLLMHLGSQAQTDSLATRSYAELLSSTNNYQHPETIAIIDYYIQKAEKENNPLEIFKGNSKMVEAYIWSRRFANAERVGLRVDSLAKEFQITTAYTKAKYLQGQAYFFKGLLSKAVAFYSQALELANEQNDLGFQIVLSNQIGYIKSFIGDHEAATGTHLHSLQLANVMQIDSTLGIAASAINTLKQQTNYFLSRSYIQQQQGDSALYYIKRVLQGTTLADSCASKGYYRTQAEAELLLNDLKAAKKSLAASKNACKPITRIDTFMMNKVYAEIFLDEKKYSEAATYLQTGLDAYGEIKVTEEGFMDTYYKSLAKAYKHTGNLERSNFYLEKYIRTTDAFIKIQDSVASTFKKQEVASFKKELAAIRSEKEQEHHYRNYILLGASLIILSLLIVLLNFYQRKKKNEANFRSLITKMQIASAKDEIISAPIIPSEEKKEIHIPEDTQQNVLNGLLKLEQQEYYLQQECSAYNIAKKLKTNTSYLSKIINHHFGKNFNAYINDLRIQYALHRLKDDVIFRSYSIESIAEEVGYKSADSFTKYFKKQTGLNPSFYIKEIKNIA